MKTSQNVLTALKCPHFTSRMTILVCSKYTHTHKDHQLRAPCHVGRIREGWAITAKWQGCIILLWEHYLITSGCLGGKQLKGQVYPNVNQWRQTSGKFPTMQRKRAGTRKVKSTFIISGKDSHLQIDFGIACKFFISTSDISSTALGKCKSNMVAVDYAWCIFPRLCMLLRKMHGWWFASHGLRSCYRCCPDFLMLRRQLINNLVYPATVRLNACLCKIIINQHPNSIMGTWCASYHQMVYRKRSWIER